MALRPEPFWAAGLLALAACAPVPQGPVTPLPPNSPEAHALMPIGTRWTITSLNGRALTAGTARFSTTGPAPTPGTVGDQSAGFTACNSHGGLPFAPLGLPGDDEGPIATMMACEDALMALDEELLATIPRVETIGPGPAPGTVDLIAGGQRVMTVQPAASD